MVVFEKEPAVAMHQSGHNSGVVHAGVYYAAGSAKAVMCRRGVLLLRRYCAARGLAWREVGKLIVARDEAEIARLRELERRAAANGVPGVEWLDAARMNELEPEVTGRAALLSPTTAIVDYPAIARAFAAEVVAYGGQVKTSREVVRIERGANRNEVSVTTADGAYRLSRLVVCAGLRSAQVARMAGLGRAPGVAAFRGEYLRFRPQARGRVRHLVYPVPDPAYPFLGVHVTPRVDGTVDIGPNAVLAFAPEGYRRTDVSLPYLAGLARSPAFRRLARRHWQAGLRELRGSLWRRSFLAEVRTYLPWVTAADVERGPTGVRAQAVDDDGTLVDDFRIDNDGLLVAVRNAPSPAATACMAIAEHIVAELGRA